MADEKITDLPVATVVNPSDVLPIVQSGTTKQAAASLIGGNVVFPDSDPHIAGAGYWVGGVLTKSAG